MLLALRKNFENLSPLYKYAFLSLLLLCIVFPDVIFLGRSFSVLDQLNLAGLNRPIYNAYHEPTGTIPSYGYVDTGGSLQFDPGISFMRHSIYNLESPYWDPYSGAGAFGPETLVDVKFSPVTLLTALLGGSIGAYHFVFLFFYFMSLVFLYRVIHEQLGLSINSAIGASMAYLLNGYFTANLGSNVNQALLYFPMLIYFILRFTKAPSLKNYFFLIISFVLPLMVTFIPTTVLMLTAAGVISVASSILRRPKNLNLKSHLAAQLSALVIALFILAPLYLPILEVLSFSKSASDYSERVFYPSNILGLLSLFSSKHFFEAYNAIRPDVLTGFLENEIFHFGIVAGIIATFAVLNPKDKNDKMKWVFLALLAVPLMRIFNLFGIAHIVDHLPFYRNIGGQYWWMMVACLFPIVFAFGFSNLEKKTLSAFDKSIAKFYWPGLLLVLFLTADMFYIAKRVGIPSIRDTDFLTRHRAINYVTLTAILIFFSIGLIILAGLKNQYRKQILAILICAMCFEYVHYFNTARYERMDLIRHPPDYISFIRKNLGQHRVASYGLNSMPAQLGSAYQIPQIESFTMNLIPSYAEFCQRNFTNENEWYIKSVFCANRDSLKKPNVNPRALNLLSVKYLLVSRAMPQFMQYFEHLQFPKVFDYPTLVIYENPFPLPRVFLTSQLVEGSFSSQNQALDLNTYAFTLDKVLLSKAREAGIQIGSPSAVNPLVDSDAKMTAFHNASISIETQSSKPSVLIMSDNWHPSWHVTVDNKPEYLGLVNDTLRGVVVKAGKHRIEMNYRPASLNFGIGLSLFTLLSLIIFIILNRKQHNLIRK